MLWLIMLMLKFHSLQLLMKKNFYSAGTPHSIVTHEYLAEWKLGGGPYSPVNDNKNIKSTVSLLKKKFLYLVGV